MKYRTHILLDMQDCNISKIDDEEFVRQVLLISASKAKMTMLSIQSHKIKRVGVNCILSLEESHMSLHSFPESKTVLIDIFTYGNYDPMSVIGYMINEFESKKYNVKTINRGEDVK